MAAVEASNDEKARYNQAKKDLIAALAKKRQLDKQLAQLEVHIYDIEGAYLHDTSGHSGGNIIHGFDGYLKNQVTKKRYEIQEHDRLFSTSSLTYAKSLDLQAEGDESTTTTNDDYRALTTVVLPSASRPPEISPAQAKKNRDREYQRRKRAQQTRRGISETPGLSDDDGPRRKRARYED
ncbi:NuA4-domain-containing protein [Peniophora sp. CONT]|nr:NuA4-domain-containing protein [Peniophora sp. CONT]